MNDVQNMMNIVREIIAFSPRQLENEHKTAQYIMDFLEHNNISFITEEYNVDIPLVEEANLEADGISVPCEGSSMVSGDICGKDHIVSSLLFDVDTGGQSLINFNPQCSSISLPVFYEMPALAVSHDALQKILAAKDVRGSVRVSHITHRSINILVGNKIDPQKICFTHYDSIKTGAIDNASGVAVMMELVKTKRDSLKNTLYVFAANEELSCDGKVYWGNGYREFEKKHHEIMAHATQIVAVDSVGNGPAEKIIDPNLLHLGFPIVHIDEWKNKITFIAGDFAHLMTVYHSNDDDGRGMTEEYLQHAYAVICETLQLLNKRS